MRIPDAPPDLQHLHERLIKSDPFYLSDFLNKHVDIHTGRYLHWDEIKRRTPPRGMSHEKYWLFTKITRSQHASSLPFEDKHGNSFSFCETDSIRRSLRSLDVDCAGNLGASKNMPSEGQAQTYLARSILEEPISSSILEGAATTRARAREMIEKDQRPKDRNELMIMNNYRAMRELEVLKDEPMSPELILYIHKMITEGTLENLEKAGVLRTASDYVVVEDEFGEVLHEPPAASELRERIQKLCDFANGTEDDEPFVHPIIRAIVLHFMLAYDHPFVDGNGRVARALFYWSALRSGFWLMKHTSISYVIREAPVQYGQAFLKVETDPGDMTYFVDHHMMVLRKAMDKLREYLDRQQKKIAVLEALLAQKLQINLNHRQIGVLKALLKKTMAQVRIQDIQRDHGVSYLTARKDLEVLVRENLLSKRKVGRDSIYRPVPDLQEKLAEASET